MRATLGCAPPRLESRGLRRRAVERAGRPRHSGGSFTWTHVRLRSSGAPVTWRHGAAHSDLTVFCEPPIHASADRRGEALLTTHRPSVSPSRLLERNGLSTRRHTTRPSVSPSRTATRCHAAPPPLDELMRLLRPPSARPSPSGRRRLASERHSRLASRATRDSRLRPRRRAHCATARACGRPPQSRD